MDLKDQTNTSSPSPTQRMDRLTISTLSLDTGTIAPYVFGERKLQPATLDVSLDLNSGFSSAASSDALDQNTVHYGNLAKAIRDGRPAGQTLQDLVRWAEGAVERMGARGDGSSRIARSVVSVGLGKASMSGEGVRVTCGRGEGVVRCTLMFEGVRVMTLIGVNSVERTAKQPLVVDLELQCASEEVLERDVEAFGLEKVLVEIIEATSFETLESLGEHVVLHLRSKIREALRSCETMTLTMKKPKAIAFAEAPALTLVRPVSQAEKGEGGSGSARSRRDVKLNLIKPYV